MLFFGIKFMVGVYDLFFEHVKSVPFESKKWKETKDLSVRRAMTMDVIRRHLTPGMTEAEVKAILGEPDESHNYSQTPSFSYRSGFGLVYNLQREQSEWTHSKLLILLDEKKKIVSSKILNKS